LKAVAFGREIMKLIHSLAILGMAAGLGATSQSPRGSRTATEPAASPSAQVETPPWLTDAWSDDTEDETADDPHAGLYADGAESGEDPHAELYADGDDYAGTTCPAGGGDDPDAEVYARVEAPHTGVQGGAPHEAVHADPDPHAAGAIPPSVERSRAPNGKTVAEVFAGRAALAEQRVRVRGTVVKLTENVLGKTYLHLRDGSGRERDGDADLTVTTAEPFELGETVELEGQLAIDQDVGVGYVYAALLSDALRVRP
jgi:hypothetical protein